MTKHSKILPRGFDTIAQRNILHGRIDRLLDEHAILDALASLDGTDLAAIQLITGI